MALSALSACGGSDGEPIAHECRPGEACGSSGEDFLPSQVLACQDTGNQSFSVPPKTITIHNNSKTETLYPVLATSKNTVNEWLQGCFRTKTPYPTHYVYKLYVNEGTGLPPGASVTITLPLYSELAPGALKGAKKEAPYITWWNGGRVVLADENERLLDVGTAAGQDAPFTTPENVTCLGKDTACKLTAYYSDVQFPEHIYAQLSEYTFGDSIVPAADEPRVLKPENVGYNISYVDHVYMPVAIGPKNNPYIGYSGSVEPLDTFRTSLSAFLTSAAGDGWPVYNLDKHKDQNKLKLPGGYNIFAQRSGTLPPTDQVPVKPADPTKFPPVLSVLKCLEDPGCNEAEKQTLRFGAAVQRMQNLWGSCIDDWVWTAPDVRQNFVTQEVGNCDAVINADGLTLRQALTAIKDFFKENHKNYLAMYSGCTQGAPQVPEFTFWQAITHIYGWVPFNEGCDADANALANTRTPDWNHADLQSMYIHDLQYNHLHASAQNNPELLFNPYVRLIHDDLNMNAYGFSVDDAVGFMSELGSGLIFTVGGPQGLENSRQFDYATGFSLALGVPAGMNPNEALITSYGVCALNTRPDDPQCMDFTQDVLMPTNSLIAGFRVGTVPRYPIRVNFTDAQQHVYSILVKAPFDKCPEGANAANCPTNKAALMDPADCFVLEHHGSTQRHPKSANWCTSANPNQQREKQLTKNYLSFATPVDLL